MAPRQPQGHKPPSAPASRAIDAKTADSAGTKPVQIRPVIAFSLFLIANTLAAAFSPIQDCDEVFNYWEPTHYLNHGYGLQTWEYSPEYAIRSWAYTGLHATVIWLGRLLTYHTKAFEFYFLRCMLALFCAICETRLYSTISRNLNPRIAAFFLIILIFSPGMYHAVPAYLPSSFAMYTTMLGVSAFMDWQTGMRTAEGICWFAVGSLLGWPFAAALVLPFVLEEVLLAVSNAEILNATKRLLDGAVRSFGILGAQTAIDSLFYRKLVCVPLNIVLYNVFSGGNKGPNIYGTEPWHFYIRNLVLNFNIWFFLAIGALPLLLVQHLFLQGSISGQKLLRGATFVTPFYLWLAIFTVQPHKEERFMYPAYPVLALNAAISLHILLANFGSTNPRFLVSKIRPQVKLFLVSIFILGAVDFGALRTFGLITAYSAPLKVYGALEHQEILQTGGNICLGKEWYRFPSSYFLPERTRAKFIKSEFSGLLPGEFHESDWEAGFLSGTWLLPSGMNDENIEDTGKYTAVGHCDFIVDSQFPGIEVSSLEPDYGNDIRKWEKVSCRSFLDAGRTPFIGRLLWVPDWNFIPDRYRRRWGTYCLLRRKKDDGQTAFQ